MSIPLPDRIKTTAVVTVTVKVHANSDWSDNCPVRQIREQAAEAAINTIKRQLTSNVEIVGDPKVSVVTMDQ